MSVTTLGSSHLTNCVEGVYGYAAACALASDEQLMHDTMNHGFRLVTHESKGHASNVKPYRWMHLRRVERAELELLVRRQRSDDACQRKGSGREAGKGKGKGKGKHDGKDGKGSDLVDTSVLDEGLLRTAQGQQAAWHCIIQDFFKEDGSKPGRVLTSIFLSNSEVVADAAREKFGLLASFSEDDPRIIHDALGDQDFVELLRLYFASGNRDTPKFYKHLATSISISSDGEMLFQMCCNQNLVRCVDYLLRNHSVQRSHPGAPWLQLADPLFQDRKWGNWAFAGACYDLRENLLQTLLQWASEGADAKELLRRALLQMKDKKGATCIDLLVQQLKKAHKVERAESVQKAEHCMRLVAHFLESSADLADRVDLKRAVDSGSQEGTWTIFEEVILTGRWQVEVSAEAAALGEQRGVTEEASIVVDDSKHERRFTPLPKAALTVAGLCEVLESSQLQPSDRILLKGLQLVRAAAGDEASLRADCRRLSEMVRGCARFSFLGCSPMDPELWLAVGEALLEQLELATEVVRLESINLVVPLLPLPAKSDFPQRFSAFLERLLEFSIHSFDTRPFHEFSVPSDVHRCVTEDRRSLPLVIAHSFWCRKVLFSGSEQHAELKAATNRLGSVQVRGELYACKEHNPWLNMAAAVERKLLEQRKLLNEDTGARSADEAILNVALHPSWRFFARTIATLWARLLLKDATNNFLKTFGIDNPSELAAHAPKLMDEALVFLLRMRPKRDRRPGLEGIVEEILAGIADAGRERNLETKEILRRNFPASLQYLEKHGLLKDI